MVNRTSSSSIFFASVLAGTIYFFTLAPGLTWANYGADGGELIAAAVQNGVPHPPGYPLYMMLLQGWLWVGTFLLSFAERSWLGNLFSAVCAMLSVGFTVHTAAYLLEQLQDTQRKHEELKLKEASVPHIQNRSTKVGWSQWGWAIVTALAWAFCPLFWGQALITEVYSLHLLLTIFLAWSLLVKNGRSLYLLPAVAFGFAHHLTFVLLLPAALYWLLFGVKAHKKEDSEEIDPFFSRLLGAASKLGLGLLIGLLFYLRIPLVAGSGPPAINWGYADSLSGFLWLISADAYRPYLFGLPTSSILQRISAWAYITTAQFTPVGLAFALLGLSYLDRVWPRFRTFCLLWAAPICIYAIGYHTRDSEIYLLPFIWIAALWLGVGFWFSADTVADWLSKRNLRIHSIFYPMVGLLFVLGLCVWRLPDISLHTDREAIDFLDDARAIIEPNSVVYSSADAETFALWYGAWGSSKAWSTDTIIHTRDASQTKPELVLINSALLQFEWYQRLIREYYSDAAGSDVAGIEQLTLEQALSQSMIENIDVRPIYFSENPPYIPAEHLEPVGRFWRYVR